MKNVREDEFVVKKAREAEVAEEMIKRKAIGLVDELFLECNTQWQKREKEEEQEGLFGMCKHSMED
ncbi:hypothetical protein NC653_037160 [Populus alba x Populus x berolinensis]|uniref:DUF7870 domain-containing protein n=1 Tax=Populus alba x Populus x berolinensis TaxID=444605 RepID=A0AAD6LDN6_9ROSI|nr:hypothetical protein NC653_037160 [Populus alba x Populus x berolinensis]